MAGTTRSTVVGVFQDPKQANRAVEELRRVGFRNDQIGVVVRNSDTTAAAHAEKGSKWPEGAVAGAITGAGLGALVGLGVMAGIIPVIGPMFAAGALATILANAASGAALASIVG